MQCRISTTTPFAAFAYWDLGADQISGPERPQRPKLVSVPRPYRSPGTGKEVYVLGFQDYRDLDMTRGCSINVGDLR